MSTALPCSGIPQLSLHPVLLHLPLTEDPVGLRRGRGRLEAEVLSSPRDKNTRKRCRRRDRKAQMGEPTTSSKNAAENSISWFRGFSKLAARLV